MFANCSTVRQLKNFKLSHPGARHALPRPGRERCPDDFLGVLGDARFEGGVVPREALGVTLAHRAYDALAAQAGRSLMSIHSCVAVDRAAGQLRCRRVLYRVDEKAHQERVIAPARSDVDVVIVVELFHQ